MSGAPAGEPGRAPADAGAPALADGAAGAPAGAAAGGPAGGRADVGAPGSGEPGPAEGQPETPPRLETGPEAPAHPHTPVQLLEPRSASPAGAAPRSRLAPPPSGPVQVLPRRPGRRVGSACSAHGCRAAAGSAGHACRAGRPPHLCAPNNPAMRDARRAVRAETGDKPRRASGPCAVRAQRLPGMRRAAARRGGLPACLARISATPSITLGRKQIGLS